MLKMTSAKYRRKRYPSSYESYHVRNNGENESQCINNINVIEENIIEIIENMAAKY
jgi:hypothetical protein